MNIAVMLAGGVGRRTGAPIPKQFIPALGKPVIVHTLETYEKFSCIDAVEVVTVEGWIDEVKTYPERYGLKKLKWVTLGGDSAQESIRNGIFNLEGKADGDDIISIVSSLCPLTEEEILEDAIRVCKKHGGAVAGGMSIYNLTELKDGYWGNDIVYKENHVTLNFPWTYPLKTLLWAYHKGDELGILESNAAYTPTLMVDLGEKLFFSKESVRNRQKIVTLDDVDLIEGYLLIQELRKGNTDAVNLIRKNKTDCS
ncbi:MAG: 2-C-methyl-D-erythritol 4-phosphate cytidylyltransferase [Lachnospiraceae bacterium]|nr:2-C-methyl-D-erythritol 4-phosphate cytidylyltransferase [Lachnospiraceae bacterium]